MVYICKGACGIGITKAMINVRPTIAYMVANRCSICSDINASVWYLKRILKCPCCGTKLKHKSKHSYGREKVTEFLKTQTPFINSER